MTEYVNTTVKLDTIRLSPSYGSVLSLGDGRLMWAWRSGVADPIQPVQANFSEDEGATTAPYGLAGW